MRFKIDGSWSPSSRCGDRPASGRSRDIRGPDRATFSPPAGEGPSPSGRIVGRPTSEATFRRGSSMPPAHQLGRQVMASWRRLGTFDGPSDAAPATGPASSGYEPSAVDGTPTNDRYPVTLAVAGLHVGMWGGSGRWSGRRGISRQPCRRRTFAASCRRFRPFTAPRSRRRACRDRPVGSIGRMSLMRARRDSQILSGASPPYRQRTATNSRRPSHGAPGRLHLPPAPVSPHRPARAGAVGRIGLLRSPRRPHAATVLAFGRPRPKHPRRRYHRLGRRWPTVMRTSTASAARWAWWPGVRQHHCQRDEYRASRWNADG